MKNRARIYFLYWVRYFTGRPTSRLREGEEAAPRAEARGLQCREELAPTLLAALAAITTAPVRVSELADGPLFDAFGKRCFAQVAPLAPTGNHYPLIRSLHTRTERFVRNPALKMGFLE